MSATSRTIAVRLHVSGLVQGVGFRPFVHRLAIRHGVDGWVRNTSGRVEIHAEGDVEAVDAFACALRSDAPVLARIEAVVCEVAEPESPRGFVVAASVTSDGERQPVSPDVATCDACLAELADPGNRRHRYPFITCTDCGPRFTVIESMPYDRERTSMRRFSQCRFCLAEYDTPGDRRYHSETNSCPACGPRLWLATAAGVEVHNGDPIAAAAEQLRAGHIMAIRGLGGFHLAVDATNEAAVARLRERKHREAKPLAVMIASLEAAAEMGFVPSEAERQLLQSSARPIVLLRVTGDGTSGTGPVAPSVAPGLSHVGVMLPYTPVHHLLLAAAGRPLVMTSGNLSDEPIATGNEEGLSRLGAIADAFLLHDREIVARYDDSVLRVAHGAPVFLRRSRGYAPMPVALPAEAPRPLLAVGPHLKNTFTLVHGRQAYVSQHIGDLENLETVEHWTASLERFTTLFHAAPELVVHDLHPGYLSTRLAIDSGLRVLPPVQHHHAHVAAVMAEHGCTGPVIGVAFDGTGHGDDGATWGSEIMLADLTGYRRLAHLRYAPLPGGDAAARAPWRAAAGYLEGMPEARVALTRALAGVPPLMAGLVRQQLARRVNSPPASSMGRLFDAAAAVLGIRRDARYEGEAAMALEAIAGDHAGTVLPFCITGVPGGVRELDPLPLLVTLGERADAGEPVERLAASFHDTVVHATAELVRHVREETGCAIVALGGGCFQNARLLAGLSRRLEAMRFDVLIPRQLSPNDGAVSFGQAAVAIARMAAAAPRASGADPAESPFTIHESPAMAGGSAAPDASHGG